MPFGRNCEFQNFDACVKRMTGKVRNAKAWCGAVMRDTESK